MVRHEPQPRGNGYKYKEKINMIREIIRPSSEYYSLHIPKEYIDKDIEILILPFEYPEDKNRT